MFEMSKIEKLIKQYCPNGVEYVEVKNVAEIGTGSSNRADAVINGIYPFYVRSKDVLRINKFEFDEEAIIIPGEGGIGDIFHYANGKYALHQRAYRIHFLKRKLSTKFVYYYMIANFKSFIFSKAVSATVTSIRKPMIEKFKIPVPPLPVQEEIVKILDAFTSLEAELEAELEARKKQYEYYRNQLLSFDENTMGGGRIKFMQLGDVATIQRGKRLTKPQLLQDGLYPVFHGGIEPLGYYNQKNRESDTVMVINVGASAGTVGYSPVDFWSSDGCFCISHSKLFLNKYLYYTLKTKEALLQSKVRKAGIPTLDNSVVEKVIVPIPPLDEQERIVAILDKFDSLVNDISEGLPAEINARRQQYEHYRNQLLTFDEAA